ncbi:MAG: GNAT family N-acetyltransferase [Propionicimonas sp.]|jgi:predicted GNAT family acetyltransferase
MSARTLTLDDLPAVRRLLAADPVSNVFFSSRIDAGVLHPGLPGTVLGWPSGEIRALLHIGANLVPVAEDYSAVPAFVEAVGRRRTCQSIVGTSSLALAFWRALSERWGRAYSHVREVRASQPLMAISDAPAVAPDARVRPITMADFDSYFEASVAMYTEEVGVVPGVGPDSNYRGYCRWLVEQGRAFGIVSEGQVIFKSDIGAASGDVAQIQGVWLAPQLRGRSLSVPAMAAVTEYVLAEFAVACLYVNDFNLPAIRSYQRVGFEQVGELATVLY